MKKILILLTSLLAVGAIGLCGCNGDKPKDENNSARNGNYNVIQQRDDEDCKDGNCNEDQTPDFNYVQPIPRTNGSNRISNRTQADAEDNYSVDENCPHCRHGKHRHRKPRKDKTPAPAPSPKRMPQHK